MLEAAHDLLLRGGREDWTDVEGGALPQLTQQVWEGPGLALKGLRGAA